MSTIEIKITASPENLAEAVRSLASAFGVTSLSDDAPEWSDKAFDRAEIRQGSEIARPATGTLTKDETAEKPKTARAKKTEPAPETAKADEPADAPSATTDEASSSTSQSEEPSAVSYPDVQARVIGLAKHSRDAATGLLGEFGVSHGKELKEEQWAEFVAAADAKIEEFANA